MNDRLIKETYNKCIDEFERLNGINNDSKERNPSSHTGREDSPKTEALH